MPLNTYVMANPFNAVATWLDQQTQNRGVKALTAFEKAATGVAANDPLNNGQYAFNNLKFPYELGVEPYHHYVCFFINETATTQYPNPLEEATKGVTNFPNNPSAVVSDLNLNADKLIDRGHFKRNTRRIATAIAMYMPPIVSSNYTNAWGEETMGVVGDIWQDWTSNPGNYKQRLLSMMADTGQSVVHDILNKGLNNVFGYDLHGKEIASAYLRAAYNPHQEVLYNGTKFRRFDFAWQINPRSEKETELIHDIIKVFKFYSAPEINTGMAGRFFQFPAEFDIKFYDNGQENKFINKISTCGLTNIQVSYGSDFTHYVALRNGSPTQITIRLSFTELELITKERILEGY